MGLMQLMPATAQEFGVRNAFNPAENARRRRVFRRLLDRYGDNEDSRWRLKTRDRRWIVRAARSPSARPRITC
jgi:soluble lytic murein transglycosylase-like protein